MLEVTERIRSLYEQGLPFFKKSVFQDLVRQLDNCRANDPPVEGQIISIPAVDGSVVEVELETGLVMHRIDKETELVVYGFPIHPFILTA